MTPDPSPPYRKASKGYNSKDDDDDGDCNENGKKKFFDQQSNDHQWLCEIFLHLFVSYLRVLSLISLSFQTYMLVQQFCNHYCKRARYIFEPFQSYR